MEEPEVIRGQLQETRAALAQKLQALENKVAATVQVASEDVESVAETFTAVKEGVGNFKSMFDLPHHVDRHPWLAVGGSAAFGFVLGEKLWKTNGHARTAVTAASPKPFVAMSQNPGRIHNLRARLEPEMSRLKGLALGTLMGTVREMIAGAAGEKLGPPLREVLDSITEKLGGTVIGPGPQAVKTQTGSQFNGA